MRKLFLSLVSASFLLAYQVGMTADSRTYIMPPPAVVSPSTIHPGKVQHLKKSAAQPSVAPQQMQNTAPRANAPAPVVKQTRKYPAPPAPRAIYRASARDQAPPTLREARPAIRHPAPYPYTSQIPRTETNRRPPKDKAPIRPPMGMDGTPASTGGEGGGGARGNPYPDFGAGGSSHGGPLTGDSQSMPSFGPPAGARDPGGQLVTPENMSRGDAAGSTGNLYGGVIPGRNPGGGSGEGASNHPFVKAISGATFDENGNGITADGGTVEQKSTSNGYYINVYGSDGRLEWSVVGSTDTSKPALQSLMPISTPVERAVEQTIKSIFFTPGTLNSVDGAGDKSEKKPWSWNDQKFYYLSIGQEQLHELLHGPAVDPGGASPVDPDRTASHESKNGEMTHGSQAAAGQAPQAAIPYVGKKPGSDLIGPTADEGAKAAYGDPILPKGFHVVDPAAR